MKKATRVFMVSYFILILSMYFVVFGVYKQMRAKAFLAEAEVKIAELRELSESNTRGIEEMKAACAQYNIDNGYVDNQ